jgi:hypothetical protein
MLTTKEESGCLRVESKSDCFALPLQIFGVGLIFSALMTMSIVALPVVLIAGLAGLVMLACGFRSSEYREFIFDPYLKKVFWKEVRGGSHEYGTVSFSEISHVLVESGPAATVPTQLSLLVSTHKLPVLSEEVSLKSRDPQSIKLLAGRIRQLVGVSHRGLG